MAQQDGQNGNSDKPVAAVTFTVVRPQLVVKARKMNEAVQFYKAAFGAVETGRTTHLKRKAEQELPHIISAELNLAGTTILVSGLADDSLPEKTTVGGGGISLVLVTADVETAISKAVAAGALKEGEIVEGDGDGDGAYGVGSECVVKVKDPFGFVWVISSLVGKQQPAVDVEA